VVDSPFKNPVLSHVVNVNSPFKPGKFSGWCGTAADSAVGLPVTRRDSPLEAARSEPLTPGRRHSHDDASDHDHILGRLDW
jgi:hypothetical protein